MPPKARKSKAAAGAPAPVDPEAADDADAPADPDAGDDADAPVASDAGAPAPVASEADAPVDPEAINDADAPRASKTADEEPRSAAEDGLWGKRLTRYEMARLISARTQQITDGALSTLPEGAPPSWSPHQIAVRELEEGVIPLAVQREWADGKVETFRVDELKIPSALLTHHRAMALL